ncbi:hypothetical protein AAFC00_005962 [Neodothiora populina]|uniref:Glucosidase 2 subunit beta n=1 Tax=Neodothiora populina TaxID=2781224 RepID=A0ABR3P6L4_9PEZI
MMRVAGAYLLTAAALGSSVVAAAEPSRPRGVSPEFAKFYKDAAGFTCISNLSIQISRDQVNDDYCDCPDGSDEPGTSACSYLSPLSPSTLSDLVNTNTPNSSAALPGFYCKNKGHIPGFVPFTNVNDGVCDYEACCDGSEEWAGVGGIKCPDRCSEIGKEWRKHDEARQKSLDTANRKRKELVNEAQKQRKEVEDRITTLQTTIEAQQKKVSNLETELVETERREKGRVVKAGSAKVGKVGVLVGLAKQRMDELREALINVRKDRDSNMERIKTLESILSTFKEEYNPNFNDEGVKRAVRAWEDYAALDKGAETDAVHERDLNEITKSDKDNGLDWESFSDADESEVELLYKFEEYLPKSLRDWLDQKLRDLRVMLVENGILADLSPEASASGAVTDAQNRLKSAEDEVKNSIKSLESHQEDLNKNYGPDDVFRALKGQCISTDSGEYTYELCFLERTTQKPKKGGGNTNMGSFVGVDSIYVDEDITADGKGLGTGERIAMRHENGQHCWNGPNRSTTVILACAEKNEIWKIFEEEKCVYRMEVGTPAVCEVKGGSKNSTPRDEL